MSSDLPDDHVLIFPDGDEVLFGPDLQPGQQEQETLIEVDPLIQEFLRSPYDPVVGMMAFGRLTGEVVRNPPRHGWMRGLAWLAALVMIASGLIALMGDSPLLDMAASAEQAVFGYLQPLAFAEALAAAGVLLVWRLARR